jgi:glucose/arabinose dehydrogenase
MRSLPIVTAAAALLCATAQAADVAIIASGLSNPRGLAFDDEGRLYVAEAGRGGDTDNCIAVPAEPGAVRCLGFSGALTRVDKTGTEKPKRIVRKIPSLAVQPAGTGADGLVDIAFGPTGRLYGVIGFGGGPDLREDLGRGGFLFGKLVRFVPHEDKPVRVLADILKHEARRNPAGGPVDSNPYGLDALFHRRVIADAGGNSLVEATAEGKTRTLAVFPTRILQSPIPPGDEVPVEAVPTTVTRGPDGFLYVGQLTGFPFPVGAARVYRVPPEGGTPEIYAEGFTNIVDIAFGLNGELYVLEIARDSLLVGPPGRLLRVLKNGSRSTVTGGLVFPGGVAVDRDGTLYVTNFGTSPDQGEVLRIEP